MNFLVGGYKISVLALVLISSIFFSVHLAKAQEFDQLPELQEELGELQGKLEDVDTALERALLQESIAIESSRKDNSGFFQPDNIALWLFWAIILTILLLLFAVRKNIRQFGSRNSQTASKKVVNKSGEEIATVNAGMATRRRTSDQTLVKPVKIVKIKVRKLKGTKKSQK